MRYVLCAVVTFWRWGAVAIPLVAVAAVATAWCLSGLLGMSTTASTVTAAVLGALALVLLVLCGAALLWLLGEFARRADRGPSASSGVLTDGNLPHRTTADANPAAANDDPEVWE